MLAAILGEFGRSLVKVSEIMQAEAVARAHDETPPEFTKASFKDAIMTRPGESLIERVTSVRDREIEFPVPQRPMVLQADDSEEFIVDKTARKILIALAQFGRPMTAEQIGFYTGLAHKGGSFQDTLRGLVAGGFVMRVPPNFGAKYYTITRLGGEELVEVPELPKGDALFEFWCTKLGTTSEKILRALRPELTGVTMAALGDETGLPYKGGSFQDAVRGLRKMQLVTKAGAIVQLAPEFRRAVAPTIGVFDKSGNRTHKIDAHKGHVR